MDPAFGYCVGIAPTEEGFALCGLSAGHAGPCEPSETWPVRWVGGRIVDYQPPHEPLEERVFLCEPQEARTFPCGRCKELRPVEDLLSWPMRLEGGTLVGESPLCGVCRAREEWPAKAAERVKIMDRIMGHGDSGGGLPSPPTESDDHDG